LFIFDSTLAALAKERREYCVTIMIHFCNRGDQLAVDDFCSPCPVLQISSLRILHDGWAVRNLRRDLGKGDWLPIVSSLDWAASAALFLQRKLLG
jgi:hypothetical protein